MDYKVLISLGSNKGDRQAYLREAIRLIGQSLGTVIAVSPLYESPSWGYNDEAYLNNAICLVTKLKPLELIASLLEIEKHLGRKRVLTGTYESRIIDLDIVLIEGLIINHEKLQVPHPRMNLRKFVLQPLTDIAPDWIHEETNYSICDLLARCEDKSEIKYYGEIEGNSEV